MNKMNAQRLTVGARLFASFGSICALLLLVLGIGIYELRALNENTLSIVDDRLPKISQAYSILQQTDRVAIALRNMMLNSNAEDRKQQLDEIVAARDVVLDNLAKLEASAVLPQGKELLNKIVEARKQYIAGQGTLIELINADKEAEARIFLNEQLRPKLMIYKDAILSMIRFQIEVMDASKVNSAATYAQARVMLASISACALLLAIAIGFYITRGLRKQLGGEPAYAGSIAQRIAGGDLTVDVHLRPDDHASMLHAMRSMRDNLADIVFQVRQGTEAIATASRQIASGNLDLSSRTEEQASALEQTASSLEELTSTVRQNADHARQANSFAETASTVASRGGVVVAEVVQTMDEINASSKQIVDIISVIDGIAFQTNILALNAAVEAARAGEQGRGFAVVASEVRTLAQRSANAAKEIKDLISNSVEKVDAGAKLVDQAGMTMQEIVDSIQRVTDIMREISAASEEQTTGIEQINKAITEMDQVTQQNASLVEEAAGASMSMQEQAVALLNTVSTFKLSGAQPAAPATMGRTALTPSLPSNGQVARPASKPERGAALAASDDWEEF